MQQTRSLSPTETLACALFACAQRMDSAPLTASLRDGCLSARVIGEFSAGKTRLLRELFKDKLPEELFPVSSIERQTKLSLEITYGDKPKLELVERASDGPRARVVRILSRFPERQEITQEFQPETHRLRLALPEPRLILPEGDHYQEERVPMRLFLIDMPGWNSGEDEVAEQTANQTLVGDFNLALIYVSDARRLDGELNGSRLREFLAAMQDANFLKQTHLIYVVTHCSPEEGISGKSREDPQCYQQRVREHVIQRVQRLWSGDLEADSTELNLEVWCLDFKAMEPAQLQQFREEFWSSLLAPLREHNNSTPGHPWSRQIRYWPSHWDIRPHLTESLRQIHEARRLTRSFKVEGEYFRHLNATKLKGLNSDSGRQRLRAAWLRQQEFPDLEAFDRLLAGLECKLDWPSDHPWTSWWQDYWQNQLQVSTGAVRELWRRFAQALEAWDPGVENLETHSAGFLDEQWSQLPACLDNSFTRLVETVQSLVDEPEQDKLLATLLSLSLLEARYREHYEALTHEFSQG